VFGNDIFVFVKIVIREFSYLC